MAELFVTASGGIFILQQITGGRLKRVQRISCIRATATAARLKLALDNDASGLF